MSKPNTRPLPENSEYQLSSDGRLQGPCGLCRPHVPRGCRPRSARYSVMVGGVARHITVSDMMRRVWDISFVPGQAWIDDVRSVVEREKQDRSSTTKKREKSRAMAGRVPVVPVVEEWRALPEEPRYELSNQGRMRGPHGQLSPHIKEHGRPSSSLYMIKDSRANQTRGVMIRVQMGKIWDVDFDPNKAWVEKIRAEVSAQKLAAKPALKIVKNKKEPIVEKDPTARHCKDCGKVLTAGYWRRCADCWVAVRRGIDMPLEEYATCSSNGRR